MFSNKFATGLRIISLFSFLLFQNLSAQIYLDSTASIDQRVSDLLSRMTLEEKVGQMTQIDLKNVRNDPEIVTEYFLGSILSGGGSNPGSNTPEGWANMYDQLQQAALNTRLKIPIIYGIDAVHGHNNLKNAVIFPHNIGLGAARDADLVERIGRATAVEVAATGLDWTFAPCIAVPRDERWGRTYEGFAETPEVTGLLGAAYTRGFQGDTLADSKSILACAKHFIGDGGTTNGDDQGNTAIDEATLREIHLPAYIAAIENNVGSIMATYNSWNGEKVHGSHYLLTEVLKEELGFEGFIVSDWAAIDQLPGNYRSDVKESINAGIDMVMVPHDYEEFTEYLIDLVNDGEVSIERINDAVARILRIKFMMGLFEHPYSNRSLIDYVGTEEHREIGREAVRKSMVLLQRKDGTLPLSKSDEKIFVAGVGGNDIGMQCGGWTISWQGDMGDITEGTTILEAIQNTIGSQNVIYSDYGETNEEFDKAVVVIGEQPYAEGEGDREDLTISNDDIALVRKVYEKGKPTIVILLSGRPMIINPILHYSDAIFAAWLPGTEGQGIADVLFGDYQPSGKLSHSWPKYMDQIPINVGDQNYDPLYEYDFGLTSVNDSEFGSDPQFYSAIINEAEETIEIAFNKSIDPSSLTESTFRLKVAGIPNELIVTPKLSDESRYKVYFELTVDIQQEQKLVISYISGSIKSEDGGTLQPFEDKFVYNTFNEVLQPFMLPGKIEAEDYHYMFGIQTEGTTDVGGGLNVGWIDSGDWLQYYVSFIESGSYRVNYRVAALSQNGILSLRKEGSLINSTLLPVTNGWQNWVTVSAEVEMEKGEYFIDLYATQGGFNINWFSFDLITNVDQEDVEYDFSLGQNYPNPFNPSTSLSYSIPQNSFVKLKLYDALGCEVDCIICESQTAGKHTIVYDASDLSSGVYYYRLTAGEKSEVKKLLLLK